VWSFWARSCQSLFKWGLRRHTFCTAIAATPDAPTSNSRYVSPRLTHSLYVIKFLQYADSPIDRAEVLSRRYNAMRVSTKFSVEGGITYGASYTGRTVSSRFHFVVLLGVEPSSCISSGSNVRTAVLGGVVHVRQSV
jgi:hypothetical protein